MHADVGLAEELFTVVCPIGDDLLMIDRCRVDTALRVVPVPRNRVFSRFAMVLFAGFRVSLPAIGRFPLTSLR